MISKEVLYATNAQVNFAVKLHKKLALQLQEIALLCKIYGYTTGNNVSLEEIYCHRQMQ